LHELMENLVSPPLTPSKLVHVHLVVSWRPGTWVFGRRKACEMCEALGYPGF